MQLLESLLFVQKFLLLSILFGVHFRCLELWIFLDLPFLMELTVTVNTETHLDQEFLAILLSDLVWISFGVDV